MHFAEDFWTNKAFETIGANNRGKELRRDGFSLAEEAFRKLTHNILTSHMSSLSPHPQNNTNRSSRRSSASRRKLDWTPTSCRREVELEGWEPSLGIGVSDR